MKNKNYFGPALNASPLHYCDTLDEVKVFLDQGIKGDESTGTLLSSPIHSVEDFGVLEAFLKAGANPNAGSINGRGATPIHTQTRLENLQLLMNYGANINLQNNCGQTPLAVSESLEKVKFLLENGADPNIRDDDGLLPDEWWTSDDQDDNEETKEMKRLVNQYRLVK